MQPNHNEIYVWLSEHSVLKKVLFSVLTLFTLSELDIFTPSLLHSCRGVEAHDDIPVIIMHSIIKSTSLRCKNWYFYP